LKLIRRFWKFPIPAVLTGLIDNPIRRRIQPPKKLIKKLKLEKNMILLEVGPGKGTYTCEVAKEVPNGKLIVIDIQERVIKKLKSKCEKLGITNVEPKVMDVYNLNFDNKMFDRIFLVSCLPEIPDPVRALEELNRVLKPTGLLCLVETFPDPDYPLSKTEIRWAKDARLKLEFKDGNWFVYYLIFSKSN
jgi:ubiquinone/menaquinone biosynthesis C-methylase UbiE